MYLYRGYRCGYVRVGQWVVKWKDTAVHPLLFSERNGKVRMARFRSWVVTVRRD